MMPPPVSTVLTAAPSRLSAAVRPFAAELARRTGEIADTLTARVISDVPELLRHGDQISADAAFEAIEANVGSILAMLTYGVAGSASEPPHAVLEMFELLADREDGLAVIQRMHRVAIGELWQIWAAHLHRTIDDVDREHELLSATTSFMFLYLDRVCEQLSARWSETRRRRQQGLDVSPDELVRRALLGGEGEEEDLERLHYDPRRMHLAVALPSSLAEGELARRVSRLRLDVPAQMVSVRHTRGRVVWLGLERPPDERSLAKIEAAFAMKEPVGRGGTGSGMAGFRSTHREALDAQRVGLLRRTGGMTHYRDVALLAVLCADTERARALASSELGPLAINDEVTARLRETLTAYLACGESHVAAAQQLYVHQKTVSYRVRQAEKLLGRKVGERRAELEAALLLHRAFDGDV